MTLAAKISTIFTTEKHKETVRDFLAVFDILEHITAGTDFQTEWLYGDPPRRQHSQQLPLDRLLENDYNKTNVRK